MKRIWPGVAIASALLLGAATDDDPLAGYVVAGKPQQCIPRVGSRDSLVIAADQVITYQETPKRMWVTHPITHCASMDPYDTLLVEQFGGQTCKGDRFRVIRSGITIPSATCLFGEFTPYDKVPKPPKPKR